MELNLSITPDEMLVLYKLLGIVYNAKHQMKKSVVIPLNNAHFVNTLEAIWRKSPQEVATQLEESAICL